MNFIGSQQRRIGRLAAKLKSELPSVRLDASRRIEVGNRSTPVLLNGDTVLNLDSTIPDRFTAATGVTATIFVKSDDEFVRVSTSVKMQNGERAVGTTLSHAHPAYKRLLAGQPYVGYATLFGAQYLTQYDALLDASGRVIGAIYVGIDSSHERPLGIGARLAWTCFVLAGVAALALIWMFALRAQAATPTDLAATRNLYLVFGVIAAGALALILLQVVRSIVTEPLSEARAVAQRLSAGDLTSQIDVTRNDELGQLMQAINGISQGLTEIVGNVRAATNAITTAAREISAGNADLSVRTSEQAASLEETAASMTQLTTTVRHNAQNAGQANEVALAAASIATKSREVVEQLIIGMGSVKTSSDRVATIVGEIEDIAFQTNILALNAAVEAARAGEHGKSFTIVAADVRNLAQRSATAAKEIKSLIQESVLQVDQSSTLAAEAGRTMADVVSSVKRVTDIMGEISAASREQASGIEQVNSAIARMDEMTQRNAALVEEAAAAAESLYTQAERLVEAVAQFKLP